MNYVVSHLIKHSSDIWWSVFKFRLSNIRSVKVLTAQNGPWDTRFRNSGKGVATVLILANIH